MTLQGAIQELYEMREDTSLPVYYALCLADVINTLRTDVVEVKHGRWTDRGSLSCRCSECGCKANKETAFCPNCGSRMDLDEVGE